MVTSANPFAQAQTDEAPEMPSSFPTGPVGGDPSGSQAGADPGTASGNPFGMPSDFETADEDFFIDLTGVEPSSSKRQDFIGVGEHLAYVSELEKKVSKAGNPMLVFTVTCYGGEFGGKSRAVYCALTPDAIWKLTQTLEALGISWNDDKKFSIADLKARSLNTMCTAVVVPGEPYNGRATTNLDRIEAPTKHGVETGAKLPAEGQPG